MEIQTEQKFKNYAEVEEAFEKAGPFPTFTVSVGSTRDIFSVFSIEPAGEEHDYDDDEGITRVEIEYCDILGGSSKFFKKKIKFCDVVSIDAVRAKPSFRSMARNLEEQIKPLQSRLSKFNKALRSAKAKLEG